jgi:hypothetical protein
MVYCMQFMCLVAYGGQRQDIRINANEPKHIVPILFFMFMFLFC